MEISIKILTRGDTLELGDMAKHHLIIDNRGPEGYSLVLKDRLGGFTGVVSHEELPEVFKPYLKWGSQNG